MPSKVVQHIILPNEKLVIEYLSGPITIFDARLLKQKELSDKQYVSDYFFLVDLRKATLLFSDDEMDEYVEFISESTTNVTYRKSAILTNTPEQVTFSMLYRERGRDLPTEWEVFSTFNRAVQWLSKLTFTEKQYQLLIAKYQRNDKKEV